MPAFNPAIWAVNQHHSLTDLDFQREVQIAHERLAERQVVDTRLRAVVRASWERSLRYSRASDAKNNSAGWGERQLQDYRERHPLAAIMPLVKQLLIRSGEDNGLLVAVGDQRGRLLWVEGDRRLRGMAENAGFLPGTDWSEAAMGTSAPGTALATGKSVQIAGAEHFNQLVFSWNCTAVPIRHPETDELLGVIDISGGSSAVASHSLSLVEATVAAARAELSLQQLRSKSARPARRAKTAQQLNPEQLATQQRSSGQPSSQQLNPGQLARAAQPGYRDPNQEAAALKLHTLGRDRGLLQRGDRSTVLSERHTELMVLLAMNPTGLSAEELSEMAYTERTPASTVRAELLRLRRQLKTFNEGSEPHSRPYRLPEAVQLDVQKVLGYLDRGSHRMALADYPGVLLPRSEAPAIIQLRTKLSNQLREVMLSDASAEVLWRYLQLPEASYDVVGWRTVLRLLPARSPKRAAAVARLEQLQA